jgi:phosphatidylserine/phosphatidylglycerophosphate/cardiolipin synthase-like enzyme
MQLLTRDMRCAVADAVEAGRLSTPYTAVALRRYVGATNAEEVARELERLRALGMTPGLLREVLAMSQAPSPAVGATLVWSGPEEGETVTRDTGVVLRELFDRAQRTVLVVGFAVHQGKSVFKKLAERMDAEPAFDVRMCLNIERKYRDTTLTPELLKRFLDRFAREQWAGARLPTIYYDPRTLIETEEKRASLHAKCVIVDSLIAFVTSANFTEAAQARNIEVGALIDDAAFASSLQSQFEMLIRSGAFERLPGT